MNKSQQIGKEALKAFIFQRREDMPTPTKILLLVSLVAFISGPVIEAASEDYGIFCQSYIFVKFCFDAGARRSLTA